MHGCTPSGSWGSLFKKFTEGHGYLLGQSYFVEGLVGFSFRNQETN